MRTRYLTIVVVVIVVALALGTIVYVTNQSSTTSTGSSSSASTPGGGAGTGTSTRMSSLSTVTVAMSMTSISNSSDGLSLSLQVEAGGNGNMTLVVAESNTLDSVNNVTAGNAWKYPAGFLNPYNNCSPTNDPVGLAVFDGYYGMNNYTSATALPLYDTNIEFVCTANTVPLNYLFQPDSDNVSAYLGHQFQVNDTASVSFSTDGYWTEGSSTSASFNQFAPGVYTVLGADAWGSVLLLHFTVSTD